MNQEDNLLGIISSCWGGYYPTMDSIYHLNEDGIIFLLSLSFLLSFILHKFYSKTDFEISNDNQIETIEVKQYSFFAKTLVVFFIFVLISMPIFKLLNTGYFL